MRVNGPDPQVATIKITQESKAPQVMIDAAIVMDLGLDVLERASRSSNGGPSRPVQSTDTFLVSFRVACVKESKQGRINALQKFKLKVRVENGLDTSQACVMGEVVPQVHKADPGLTPQRLLTHAASHVFGGKAYAMD